MFKEKTKWRVRVLRIFQGDNPGVAWPFRLHVLVASQYGRKCCSFPGKWRQKTKLYTCRMCSYFRIFHDTFKQKQKSKCDLYVSNYLCRFSNAVTEFASRTLETKLLAGPIREGQREIVFIARWGALERKQAYIRASRMSACVSVSVAAMLNLRQKN